MKYNNHVARKEFLIKQRVSVSKFMIYDLLCYLSITNSLKLYLCVVLPIYRVIQSNSSSSNGYVFKILG